MKIGDVEEPVVALVDHGSEINSMSMDFYRNRKWPINTKHGWKIRAAMRATEELHGACPNVQVKIDDVEINQHFFVQETSSHPVILGDGQRFSLCKGQEPRRTALGPVSVGAAEP